MKAIIESNDLRKKFIADKIITMRPKVVGIFRLVMKKGSMNFRASSILDIAKLIRLNGIKVIIFEPLVKDDNFNELEVVNNFEEFSKQSEVILANRIDNVLNSVRDKVFTRDIFNLD